jgi:hypothetical protein
MPADLDQFGREYSHRAVIGWKGLVKLGHMASNAWCLFNQVDPKPCGGKIQGGLNTADPSADNHYVSKIVVSNAPAQLLNIVFQKYYVFHLLSPRQIAFCP